MALLNRNKADQPRVHRHDRKTLNPVKAGAIGLLIAAIGIYFGFAKDIPFTGKFEIKAVFEQANSVKIGSPVRVAGVNVGKVTDVEGKDGSTAAVVTLQLNEEALPIRKDATVKIRPRIFLEGNFFVDLKPGTPTAAKLADGGTIPITQTATPVQLDQVLTSLQTDSREGLQEILDGYGTALTRKPSASDDLDQDPDTRGETAAQSLNDALKYQGDGLKGAALVNDALLGQQPRDLSKLIKGMSTTAGALAKNERELKQLVTNFNQTAAAFANQSDSLRESVRLLEPTVKNANSSLRRLDASLPDARAVALSLTRGVDELPQTIEESEEWIDQVRQLVAEDELGGLSRQLSSLSPSLATVFNGSVDLFKQTDLTARCLNKVILPTANVKLDDGDLSTGVENYKDFFYAVVGLAGESQNFDGNGQYIRLQTSAGGNLTSTGKIANRSSGQNRAFGNTIIEPLGTRPKWPGSVPIYRTNLACYKNAAPDLNGPAADSGPASPAKAGTLP